MNVQLPTLDDELELGISTPFQNLEEPDCTWKNQSAVESSTIGEI